MSTIWNVSGWDMAELAKKMQRLNPFVKLAQHSFVFLDFWLYKLSWTRCVLQTWDTFSVCNLFHCRLWRQWNMCRFGWGKITDFILLVPMWCTIGWKTGGYACPILCSTQPCSSSMCRCCHQNNCTLKALNLGWSGHLVCMVKTDLGGAGNQEKAFPHDKWNPDLQFFSHHSIQSQPFCRICRGFSGCGD